MIQTLQKKVVVTAMAAVTVLLLFLLGAINVANMLIVERQVDRTLRIISDSEAGGIPPRSDGAPPFMEAPKNDYDTFLSSNFFVVRFDWVGNILNADIQRTSSVTEEEAREMAAQAYDSGQDSGRTGKFRYLFHKTPVGSVVVFLDTSGERLSLVRILLLSVALGAACWGAMLLLVMFLSQRAVRPVAESMEKQAMPLRQTTRWQDRRKAAGKLPSNRKSHLCLSPMKGSSLPLRTARPGRIWRAAARTTLRLLLVKMGIRTGRS